MEHTILEKKQLSEQVYMMRVAAPLIAEARKPGQFIILQIDTDFGERIPLTIADANAEEGWIRIIFQAVGGTTMKLAEFEEGEAVAAVLGPLGHPTHIENFGRAVCVGGGIGVAPMFPIVQALKKAGEGRSERKVGVSSATFHVTPKAMAKERARKHREREARRLERQSK